MLYFASPCQPMNKYEFNLSCNVTGAHNENWDQIFLLGGATVVEI